MMAEILQSHGYSVITASDGDEALRKVAEMSPDLVLLDVVLPKHNGFQLCRQIKQGGATQGIKVVLVTSRDQKSDRFWGLKQGADDYVTKPVDPDVLIANVARQLA
jgi:twitching motility two-component system response regulator PilH